MSRRLPGILAAGLVTLAVGAAGVTPAAASDASVSALTAKQKKAKSKALKACKKKRSAKQRNACVKAVNKKYNKISKSQEVPKGKTWQVLLTNLNTFDPTSLDIKVGDSFLWDWKLTVGGREPHDVTPVTVPSGVNRYGFKSATTADPSYTFKRQFTKAGSYSFVCTIHTLMTMNVNVTK